jgi:hypothetical protein
MGLIVAKTRGVIRAIVTAGSLAGLIAFTGLTGCGPKPSYSGIQVEKNGGMANQKVARGTGEGSVAVPGQSPALPQPEVGFSPPPFLDGKTGRIKDLPIYPGAKLINSQYGPVNGYNTVMLRAQTNAPFDKVTGFYDQILKTNGWSVDNSNRGEGVSAWELIKGDTDRGGVQVSEDPRNKKVYVMVVRYNMSQPAAK